MKILGLNRCIYTAYRNESKINFIKRFEKEKLRLETALKNYDISVEHHIPIAARKNLGIISKATASRYRRKLIDLSNYISLPKRGAKSWPGPRWDKKLVEVVLSLRREHPTYGKKKITILLARDHQTKASESTVGRILKYLMDRRLIHRHPTLVKVKRPRQFNGYAKPWKFKPYEEMEMGERVQLDHMVVNSHGKTFRHFQFWERRSRVILPYVFSVATAHSAREALLQFVKEAPFPIKSIQVDGGSEFMGEFEAECQKLRILLIVLPPKRPTYNGGVERGNRTFREEFYNYHNFYSYSLGEIREELAKATYEYNYYRPHQSLDGLTPMDYIAKYKQSRVSDIVN